VEAVFIAGSLAPAGVDIALFGAAPVAGAVLPGDMPGVVTCASFGAPVGAGPVVLVCGVAADMPPPVGDAPVLEGAMLPGDMLGPVVDAAFGAPVGAGADVWAKAAPEQRMRAAEASRAERILVS
jgi:hypothetical protein